MAAVNKVACLAVLCIVLGASIAEAAITCNIVTSKVSPCLTYLTGGTLAPGCCPGVKGLAAAASTPADRKTACNCLKSTANTFKKIDYGRAAGLPGLCKVNIPYKISPSTDCNSVH